MTIVGQQLFILPPTYYCIHLPSYFFFFSLFVYFLRFPKIIPEDLRALKKCVSLYITEKEAAVLDEVNLTLCKGEYGRERFTTNDVIVELEEFRDFFNLVNDTIICRNAIDLKFTDGGWLQINNTVSHLMLSDLMLDINGVLYLMKIITIAYSSTLHKVNLFLIILF